jgi:hypothetical protein
MIPWWGWTLIAFGGFWSVVFVLFTLVVLGVIANESTKFRAVQPTRRRTTRYDIR